MPDVRPLTVAELREALADLPDHWWTNAIAVEPRTRETARVTHRDAVWTEAEVIVQ